MSYHIITFIYKILCIEIASLKYEKEGVKEFDLISKDEIMQGCIYSENANIFNKVLAN